MGVDGNSLYQNKGTENTRILMDHGKKDTITEKKLRAIVERQKLEIGMGSQLFSNSYNMFKHCTKNTYVVHNLN